MLKKKFFVRYIAILLIFVFVLVIYSATLLNMQFANAGKYQHKMVGTYTKTFTVSALRGEIFDRNGVPLVTNKNIYNLVINGKQFPKKSYVSTLEKVVEMIEFHGCEIEPSKIPIMAIDDGTGVYDYVYSMVLSSSEAERTRLNRFLAKYKLNTDISAPELAAYLIKKYALEEYTGNRLIQLLGLCYDFDREDILGGNQYTISKNINQRLISAIKENTHNFPGTEVLFTYERVYNVPGVASHILGTIGAIWETEAEEYKAKGYPMDAIVGKSGVEKALEEYLRAQNGILERTYNQNDSVIEEKYIKEPIQGKNVYLTIDIKLQQIAERSIETTIERIHKNAAGTSAPMLNGGDAQSGAAVVIDPTTGEILALATYPSYDLTQYRQIEYYNSLTENPARPLNNRATAGLYPPGSIFKIATSVAALCEDAITPEEKIRDEGIFLKYSAFDYTPSCWFYPRGNHGLINVTEALTDSCNYFYYVVSERIGIENLNKYSRWLGLGEPTGIEIGETRGVLASIEYKESKADIWVPGDLLQSAIGQGDNAFSPLQMATMLASFLNKGVRYEAHLLLDVKEYGTNNIIFSKKPVVADSFEMSDEDFKAIKMGLSNVIENGTAAQLFKNFPVQVGGKTGTAQRHIGKESDIATFVAFAPYEEPDIVVATVIDNGAHGTWAGYAAEDIIGYYYGKWTYEDLMGIEEVVVEEDGEEEVVEVDSSESENGNETGIDNE